MKPIHKLNGGMGATLCNSCRVIISEGLTEELYCKNCLETNSYLYDSFLSPCKIHVCRCEQCRAVKRKTKNRSLKKRIKRLLNKKRRKQFGKIICYMWG
jgi:hypothetical protein